MKKKKYFGGLGFFLAVIIIIILATRLFDTAAPKKAIKYSDILNYFEDGQVETFTIQGNELTYKMKSDFVEEGEEQIRTYKLYSSVIFLNDVGETITEQRQDGTISYDLQPEKETSWILSIFPYILVIIIFGLVIFFVVNQSSGGKAGAFTKARTKTQMDANNRVTFDDVAGADEEKEELAEIVEFLKNPQKYTALGARIPKGVILVGPPGTGKTLFAKAVAGEAKVPFFGITGSDFVELYVGVGASRVRDLFEQAKKVAPSIIFIDEIDAVGRQRGAGLGGGHDEREQTLNQLLVEMDGFAKNEGVIVMAATNRPDILDHALLRPGRFDRQIVINLPDVTGREGILKVHARNKKLASDVDLSLIAKTTTGFSGADLENILNEAALKAARKGANEITAADIENAIVTVMIGVEKKSKTVSEETRKLTAYHEAGHAIVGRQIPGHDKVHEISIVPRGMAGGYTLYRPDEDKSFMSKGQMEGEIMSLLGGRVAEMISLDDISTGASNDIQRATAIARNMITKYGMSDRLGPIVFGTDNDEVFLGRDFAVQRNYSEQVASLIDEEIKRIIDTSVDKTRKILEDNRPILDKLASLLLEKEKVTGDEFEALFNVPEESLTDESVHPEENL